MPATQRFGLLNLNKPAGLTSRRLVDQVAKLVRPQKAGHAGTLDPLATGVLVVCVGKATRLIELVQQQAKSYEARFLLGRQSDTDDITGNVTEVAVSSEVTREQVEAALPMFCGPIRQVPPSFSAVHVDGARAYDLARKGQAVELAPREVDVYRVELTGFSYPEIDLSIDCGSGTYVRSIGRDLGQSLGCGAVMSALVRTRIGPYRIEDAVTPEQLTPDTLDRFLLPPTTALEGLPKYSASTEDIEQIRAGRPFGFALDSKAEFTESHGTTVAVLNGSGELLCLAEFDSQHNRLQPRRVFID
jgi:tRNA pseudouridine55 synthase